MILTIHQVLTTVTSVRDTVSSATSKLSQLSLDLRNRNRDLQTVDIVQQLRIILGATYGLAKSDSDAQVQLGVLLAITSKVLQGKFGDLYKSSNSSSLEVFIAGLEQLSSRLSVIEPNLSLLSSSLVNSFQAAEAVSTVWTYVAENLKTLKGLPIIPPQELVNKIGQEWKATGDRAKDLIDAVNGAPLSIAAEFSSDAPYQLSPSFPDSPESLEAMKLVERVKGDP